MNANNAINTDSENRRSFLALLFTAGDACRSPFASLRENAELSRNSLSSLLPACAMHTCLRAVAQHRQTQTGGATA